MASGPTHGNYLNDLLLAADVGGTKTNLAVVSARRGARDPLATGRVSTQQAASLSELCRNFLDEHDLRVTYASIGVPGPVFGGQAQATNLPWHIDRLELAAELQCRDVALMNDLAAMTYGLPELEADELQVIAPVSPDPNGNIAVLAPGTGLGVAIGIQGEPPHEHGLIVSASEGGHVDFAPVDAEQTALLTYLAGERDRVSVERVCSGMGIPNLYAFLRQTGKYTESPEIERALGAEGDATAVIMTAATQSSGHCDLCRATLGLFVRILGATAGNLALTSLATGGLYLGGGIPPRIAPFIASDDFLDGFLEKGRLRAVMERVPVSIVMQPRAPVFGAAVRGLSLFYTDPPRDRTRLSTT